MEISKLVQIIIFAIVNIAVFYFGGIKFYNIYKNVKLGKDQEIEGESSKRLKNVILIALGQKKMFKEIGPAFLHLAVYLAFLITQIELIEIFIDGFTGKHRVLYHLFEGSGFLTGIYVFVINSIEVLSVLALLATFVFLARRNLLKVPRLVRSEMNGWPKLDGNIILYLEIVLLICVFTMNGADESLYLKGQSHVNGSGSFGFVISSLTAPYFFNQFNICIFFNNIKYVI